MSISELCEAATRLSAERTDGSQAALYLLVERMRPVLLTLVGTIRQAQEVAASVVAELHDVADQLDRIQAAIDETERERDALREECKNLRAQMVLWKHRAALHGCDVENGDPDCA